MTILTAASLVGFLAGLDDESEPVVETSTH